ncbi:hypothetical protein FCV25MIE_31892 [Fagus crenata]|jgi:hypothetical protein|uniref:DUF7722 domain-containing protein n=1 Tax=Fagus sylvatica TaxID=28930 RepID=A0A2N9EZP3_FAGSY
MALSWLIHSACHVLGTPKDTNIQCHVKSLKVPNGGLPSKEMNPSGFQMPLHYPRYNKADYEKMEEWKVDLLLKQYGLNFKGNLDEKRAYAMGAFLWPGQY